MDTLKNYFTYEDDVDNISKIYENLFRQLKVVHSNGVVVSDLNSDNISFDKELSFNQLSDPINFESQKRDNIKALAKMMIGTYISLKTGFKDISNVDDEWFKNNFDKIFETLNIENFDKEYFHSIFFENGSDYYSDYLDRKRQSDALRSKSNNREIRKVLANAGSSLYEDLSEKEEKTLSDNNANLQVSFNPILITISLSIIMVLILLCALIK